MSSHRVEFPLSNIHFPQGVVPEPVIPVGIETAEGVQLVDMLLDSGADLTVLPKSLAALCHVDLEKCRIGWTRGVEGGRMKTYHTTLSIVLGPWHHQIRCAFADHDAVPPLLGRMDIFSRYVITFDVSKGVVIFSLPRSRRRAN